MEEGVIDVGPEFFGDEGEGIDADVETPLAAEVADGALAGEVIGGGDSGSGQSRRLR